MSFASVRVSDTVKTASDRDSGVVSDMDVLSPKWGGAACIADDVLVYQFEPQEIGDGTAHYLPRFNRPTREA